MQIDWDPLFCCGQLRTVPCIHRGQFREGKVVSDYAREVLNIVHKLVPLVGSVNEASEQLIALKNAKKVKAKR